MKNLNNWRLVSWILFAISTLIQLISLLHKLPFLSSDTVTIRGIAIVSVVLCGFAAGVLLMDWLYQVKLIKEGDTNAKCN